MWYVNKYRMGMGSGLNKLVKLIIIVYGEHERQYSYVCSVTVYD